LADYRATIRQLKARQEVAIANPSFTKAERAAAKAEFMLGLSEREAFLLTDPADLFAPGGYNPWVDVRQTLGHNLR
jgi:hypothetical protein